MRLTARLGIAALLVSLAGCATPPDHRSTSTYRGIHVPGAAMVAEDGSFVSTGSVASADQLELAGEAALVRLVAAAEARGMHYATVAGVWTDRPGNDGSGHEYRIEGHLYQAGRVPRGAVAIREIEAALARHFDYLPKKAVRPVKVTSPAKPVERQVDDPLVISAPDFVS